MTLGILGMEGGSGSEIGPLCPEQRSDRKSSQDSLDGADMAAGVEGGSRALPTSTSMKRKKSSRPSDGDDVDDTVNKADDDDSEEEVHHDMTEASIEPLLTPSKLGSLRSRRANASPEKFNREPLTLRPAEDERPAKKRRLEANVEITYDSTGTPRLSSFPKKASNGASATPLTSNTTSVPHTPLNGSTSPSADEILTSILLNTPNTTNQPTKRRKNFSLIHSICRDNDLLLHLVSFLTIPSLISLYAISKPFHFLFNRHHTAFILSNMRTWALGADRIYPWRCYKSLCVKDPSKLQKPRLKDKENEVNKKWDDLRDVPSLRWLQMVVWREGVCRDMMVQLAAKGLRCPFGTLDSIKRMWFLMDLPLNSHRIALIHNTEYIPNGVLLGMTFFLLKVDMLLTDPMEPPYPANHPNQRIYPNKYAGGMPTGVALRKMLLAERHLSSLWRVMRGWSWDGGFGKVSDRPMNKLDILRLWIRHKYTPAETLEDDTKKISIMGIPWHEVGTAGLERTGVAFHDLTDPGTNTVLRTIPIVNPAIVGTGLTDHQAKQVLYPHRRRIILANEKPREMLLRLDELLIREGIRRRLKMHKQWWKIMFYGFVDSLGRNIKVPTEEEVLKKLREGPDLEVKGRRARKREQAKERREKAAESGEAGPGAEEAR